LRSRPIGPFARRAEPDWMNRMNRTNALVFLALVALGVLSRFAGIAPNFAAVSAIALFAGFFFASRMVAVAVPVAAMLISDALIGWHDARVMAVVYACLAMPVLFRSWMRMSPTLGRGLVAAMVCSMAFFLFTNLAVWAFGSMYGHDLAGLALCFERALPFFRFTIAGDAVFAVLLFGAYGLATRSAGGARPVAMAARG
jgi:hypothetical protein